MCVKIIRGPHRIHKIYILHIPHSCQDSKTTEAACIPMHKSTKAQCIVQQNHNNMNRDCPLNNILQRQSHLVSFDCNIFFFFSLSHTELLASFEIHFGNYILKFLHHSTFAKLPYPSTSCFNNLSPHSQVQPFLSSFSQFK